MPKARVITGIVVVLLIGAVIAYFAITNAQLTEVRGAEVSRGDLNIDVSASGSVKAESRVEVYPPAAGALASVEVTDGARVVAGQVLAVMDAEALSAQAAQADAAYSGAVAQRSTALASAPGPADRRAAQAAADAAYSAYQLADAQYQAVLAGYGGPTPADIANAQLAVESAQSAVDAANAAYDAFYNNVYLPAPVPRDPDLETALAALDTARTLANANLLTAQQQQKALVAATNSSSAAGAAKVARDQAYAAYQGALSQQEALAKASSVSGAVSAADDAVAAASQAKALAHEALSKAEIVAPSDGIVLFNTGGGSASLLSAGALSAASAGLGGGSSSGGTLAEGSPVSPASAIFSIVSFETLGFEALVDETDVPKVKPGMKTAILLDGLPDERFESTVDSIGWESVTTPTGGTAFPVKISFQPAGQPVLLGMNGSVEISVEVIENVLTMPIEGLLEEGNQQYAFVVRDGRARRTKITVGRFTDTRVEVRSGLAEGDTVIVSGATDLEDGTRVRVK